MTNYLVTVRLGGQLIKTCVCADSATHATLLVRYAYGMDSVATTPTPLREDDATYPHYKNITPKPPSIKPQAPSVKPKPPPTSQQAQVNGLKQKVAQDKLKLQQVKTQQRQQRDAVALRKQRENLR
jgi:hypothetical protein